jgi:hypothetical protein
VGKTFEEIDTPTHGAPPGDRLIFRNKWWVQTIYQLKY